MPRTMKVDKWGLVHCLNQMLVLFESLTQEIRTKDCTMSQTILLLHMLHEHVCNVVESYNNVNKEVTALVNSLTLHVNKNLRLQKE